MFWAEMKEAVGVKALHTLGRSDRSGILLTSIFPMRIPGLNPEHITLVNQELNEMAEENTRFRFIDMTAPVAEHCLPITHPCFLHDGVHLSTRGYQIWAQEIQKYYLD